MESKDQVTGVRVLRLAGGDFDNVHPYFTSTSFFGDAADQVVFFSNRSGRFELYLLEIHSGRLVQLTEGSVISPSGACLGRTGQLFYFDGPELHCLKIEGMKDQVLYRVPTGFEAHLPTCTADGRYVAFAYKERMAQSTETNRIYSTMAETYFQRPRSVIMRIDSSNGEAVAAWGEQTWISHVIIHPTDPNLILFCHEGGSTNVTQRMWTVDLNEHLARQAKPLYLQRPGESCVHEYFTRQGDVGFQYTLESGEQREEFNAFIRPNGTWIRQYRLPGARAGHMQSNSDNSLVVGDCGYLGPGDKEGNRYMSLMTHVNGRVVVRRLCQHRSSWKTQNSHPHPVFSPDDKWVLFLAAVLPRHPGREGTLWEVMVHLVLSQAVRSAVYPTCICRDPIVLRRSTGRTARACSDRRCAGCPGGGLLCRPPCLPGPPKSSTRRMGR